MNGHMREPRYCTVIRSRHSGNTEYTSMKTPVNTPRERVSGCPVSRQSHPPVMIVLPLRVVTPSGLPLLAPVEFVSVSCSGTTNFTLHL